MLRREGVVVPTLGHLGEAREVPAVGDFDGYGKDNSVTPPRERASPSRRRCSTRAIR